MAVQKKALEEARADEFLRELIYMEGSAKKIEREIMALSQCSGPEGYVCYSMECERKVTRTAFGGMLLSERIVALTQKKTVIEEMLRDFKTTLRSIKETPVGRFIYYKYGKKSSITEIMQNLGCSRRTYFRIQHRALAFICDFLNGTETGKSIMENGCGVLLHTYFK